MDLTNFFLFGQLSCWLLFIVRVSNVHCSFFFCLFLLRCTLNFAWILMSPHLILNEIYLKSQPAHVLFPFCFFITFIHNFICFHFKVSWDLNRISQSHCAYRILNLFQKFFVYYSIPFHV